MKNINDSYGRDLDLNLLRVFAVAAEERNITRAAARLYVTQPAISAAIRRLTTFVGADLLVRQGRGVAPTKRGEELLFAARAHLQPLVAAAMAVPVFDAKSSTATVRVGVGDGMEMVFVPKLLARMRVEAPRMQLVVVPSTFRNVESLLLSNGVDLAICVADDLPRSVMRESLVLGRDIRDGFVCLYDSRFTKLPKKLTSSEYFAREHVAVSYAGDARGIVEDSFAGTRNVRVVVPTLSLVADAVEGSALLATVPEQVAEYVLSARSHFRSTPLPFELEGADLDLLWSRVANDDESIGFMRGLVRRVVAELGFGARARSRKRR